LSGSSGWSTCSSLLSTRWNKDWSAASNKSLWSQPHRRHNIRIVCIVAGTHWVARGHSRNRDRTTLGHSKWASRWQLRGTHPGVNWLAVRGHGELA